jgi:hypothetical protein
MDKFQMQDALKLSAEIHKAESQGYTLSYREDKYRLELAAMIEKLKGNQ